MKKNFLFIVLGIAVLIFAVWGIIKLTSPDQNIQTPPPPVGEVLPPPPSDDSNTPDGNTSKLQPPTGFDSLDESRSALKGEARTKAYASFTSLVADINKKSNDLQAWYSLGSIKKMFGDYKGAEQAWLFAVKIDSTFADAYANLGQLYWHDLVNYVKAEEMFLAVIKNNQTITSAYINLSNLYRYNYTEKKDEADKILLRGLEYNKDDSNLLSALATYYYDMGKRDLAIIYYERLVAADPKNKQAAEDLADLRAGKPIGSPN
ncbi:MAG: hypothetical protein AAB417_00390 [Patescibacteria group bacterium]